MKPSKPDKPACPVCGKPQETAWRPFCCKRCADVDLAHWLREDYAIPADDRPGDTNDEADS